MLNPNQLTHIHKIATANLPDTVTLSMVNRQSDQRGGMTETFSISCTDVPARLAQRTGQEREFMGREDVLADYMLTVSFDQTISEQMRVEHRSQHYEIVFVNSQRSYDTARRCLIRRL